VRKSDNAMSDSLAMAGERGRTRSRGRYSSVGAARRPDAVNRANAPRRIIRRETSRHHQ